jgi:serine/threonine-protein kinase
MDRFKNFEVIEEIGRGATCVVYHVRDPDSGREYALKVFHGDVEREGEGAEKFRREAELLGRLKHPGIGRIFEFAGEGEQPYLLMEFVTGGSLSRHIDDDVITPGDSVRIAVKVAGALEHAHKKDVVHRDIKPQNILLTEEGDPKIVDFGIARRTDRKTRTTAHEGIGSPAYMSPEQAGKGRVDHRTDIYSLGVVLYEMLTGQPPFIAETAMEVIDMVARHEPPLPSEINPNVPRKLENILLRALRKNPEKRYQSMGEFAGELKNFLSGKEVQAQGEERTLRLWSEIVGSTWKVMALVVLAFGIPFALVLLARALSPRVEEGRSAVIAKAYADAAPLLAGEGLYEEAFGAYEKSGGGLEKRIAAAKKALETRLSRLTTPLALGDLAQAEEALEVVHRLASDETRESIVPFQKKISDMRQEQQRIEETLAQGRALEAEKEYVKAFGLYRRTRKDASSPRLEAAYYRAWEGLQQTEVDQRFAQHLYQAREAQQKNWVDDCVEEATRALEIRDSSEARELLKWAKKRKSRIAFQKLMQKAVDAKRAGELKKCVTVLEKALELFPEDITARGLLDAAKEALRKHEFEVSLQAAAKYVKEKNLFLAERFLGRAEGLTRTEEERQRFNAEARKVFAAKGKEYRSKYSLLLSKAQETLGDAFALDDRETWEKARKAFQEAKRYAVDKTICVGIMELCRRNVEYHEKLTAAETRMAEMKWRSAERAFREALELRGESRPVRDGLARIDEVKKSLPKGLTSAFSIPDTTDDIFGNPVVRRGKQNSLRDDRDPGWFWELRQKGTGIPFVLIKEGMFRIGSTRYETGRSDNEEYPTSVHIRRSFYMSKYEVTRAEWEAVMEGKPFAPGKKVLPVASVSWEECIEFLRRLNETCGFSPGPGACGFRLPSESEWEYACRAGSHLPYSQGASSSALAQAGWFDENAEGKPHPVGRKEPNDWGLYDMHGNFSEWCQDVWHRNYWDYPGTEEPWTLGGVANLRVVRGGSFKDTATECRCASRHGGYQAAKKYATVGFRIVLAVE